MSSTKKAEILLAIDKLEHMSQEAYEKGFEKEALALASHADTLSLLLRDLPKLQVKRNN